MPFIDNLFAKIINSKNLARVEIITVVVASVAFFLRVLAIFLAKIGVIDNITLANTSILRALSTPFTVILFFEIFLVVTAISVSISDSVGRQYQTVSLIVMRNLFKDISQLGNDLFKPTLDGYFRYLLIDLATTALLFFLVLIFYNLKSKLLAQRNVMVKDKFYRSIKRLMSLIGLAMMAILGLYAVGDIIVQNKALDTIFIDAELDNYIRNIFLVLILIDVFLVIISTYYHENYARIITNGSLVFSSIIVRLAIAAKPPYNNLYTVIGMIFGITVFAVYVFGIKEFVKDKEKIGQSLV